MKVLIAAVLLLAASSLVAETTGLTLTPADGESVSLTVYQRGFAVVREIRRTTLPLGLVRLEYKGVPRTMDPSSVHVASLTDSAGLTVLEQSYKFNLITRDSLLERFVGEKVKYVRSILQGGTYEKILREGVLLAVNPEVVDFGDEIEIMPEGVISLPYVPEGMYQMPTLVWRLDNKIRGMQRVKASYLVDQLGWNAEYNLYYDEDVSLTDIAIWVDLQNRTGGSYEQANLSLVAGDVRRLGQSFSPRDMVVQEARMSVATPDVQSEEIGDYHVYQMPDPVTLGPNEQKQLQLLSASNIPVKKRYVLKRPVAMHQLPMPSTDRFDIELSIQNLERLGLGRPLPAGKVRVYNQRDIIGGPLLLGEDRAQDTPVGERMVLTLGKAFDLVAERTQQSFRRTSDRTTEVSYSITVRNRKKEAATVTVQEVFSGDWTIVSQTASGQKIDSTTQEYVLELEPNTSRSFEYTARTRY